MKSVVKDFLTTASDGKNYKTKYYNLDVLYTDSLTLLDQYDHQAIVKPTGAKPIYKITYDDCMKMVSHIKDSFETDVFGVEKEEGK